MVRWVAFTRDAFGNCCHLTKYEFIWRSCVFTASRHCIQLELSQLILIVSFLIILHLNQHYLEKENNHDPTLKPLLHKVFLQEITTKIWLTFAPVELLTLKNSWEMSTPGKLLPLFGVGLGDFGYSYGYISVSLSLKNRQKCAI